MIDHLRRTLWPASGMRLMAECTCGWRSEPCSNGELANQAWERHAEARRGDGARG